jgi:NADPH2:quinone reductase
MRAMVCLRAEEPWLVEVMEVADPVVGHGDVLVQIAAAGMNYPDVLRAAGRYQHRLEPPFILGSEFAGTVVRCGPSVTTVAVGDQVSGTCATGAFAERIAIAEHAVRPTIPNLSTVESAAFSVTYLTAMHSLTTVGNVRQGQRVLVLGAGGGVGSATVDLAVRHGAVVTAAASTVEKLEAVQHLGAARAVSYADLLRELSLRVNEDVDLLIDPIGGEVAERAMRALAWGGTVVSVGFASGVIPSIRLNRVLLKNLTVRGFEVGELRRNDPEADARAHIELARLVGEGMRPVIGEVCPLEQGPEQLGAMASGTAVGKIVLTMESTVAKASPSASPADERTP